MVSFSSMRPSVISVLVLLAACGGSSDLTSDHGFAARSDPAGTGGSAGSGASSSGGAADEGASGAGGRTSHPGCVTGPGVTRLYAYAKDGPHGPATLLSVGPTGVYFAGEGVFSLPLAGGSPSAVPTVPFTSISALAVSTSFLFAGATNGQLGVFPIVDGPATSAGVAGGVSLLAFDAGRLYVSGGVGLVRMNVGAMYGELTAETSFELSGIARGLAAAGDEAFVATSTGGSPLHYSIDRVSGAVATPIVTTLQEIDSVAADVSYVYWAELSSWTFHGTPTAIRRAAHDGSAVETLATLDTGIVFSLAVNDTSVFYSDGARIVQLDLANRSSVTLADGQNAAMNLTVFGGNIYWETQTAWALSATPTENGISTACID
jgi:hypothetical protein